jgi:hypothetical protein
MMRKLWLILIAWEEYERWFSLKQEHLTLALSSRACPENREEGTLRLNFITELSKIKIL